MDEECFRPAGRDKGGASDSDGYAAQRTPLSLYCDAEQSCHPLADRQFSSFLMEMAILFCVSPSHRHFWPVRSRFADTAAASAGSLPDALS
jgi:hypothetical protein